MLLSPSLDYSFFSSFSRNNEYEKRWWNTRIRRNVCHSWIADLMHKDCVYWKGRVGIWNVNLLKVLRNSLIQKHLTMFTSFISVIETQVGSLFIIQDLRFTIYVLWSIIYDLRSTIWEPERVVIISDYYLTRRFKYISIEYSSDGTSTNRWIWNNCRRQSL